MKQLLCALIVATFPLMGYETISQPPQTPILSPYFDGYETESIRLNNGIEAFLISDPQAEKAAAALMVNTGSFEDPQEALGIAHFLEHMLFLGTEKYPVESDFLRFTEEKSGKSNAFTEGVWTTFLFTIDPQYYDEALVRFSEFFKTPLFNASGAERERHAVDNEFQGLKNSDSARLFFVLKALGNPQHPGNKFNVGSHDTLKNISTKQLRSWYQNHYSANLMKVILISPEPLAKLKERAELNFEEIKNKQRAPIAPTEKLLSAATKGKIAYITPIKDLKRITLVWELPSSLPSLTDSHADNIISFILGHEGENSLLNHLKQEGLAEGLSAGSITLAPNTTLFAVQIDLTSAGIKEYQEVLKTTFEALAALRYQGISEELYQDYLELTRLDYQYPNRKEIFERVSDHAKNMQKYPLKHYPENESLPTKYDPEALQDILDVLTPDQAFISILASPKVTEVAPKQKEKWMQVPYTVKKVPQEVWKKWMGAKPHSTITAPAPNRWIPKNIDTPVATPDKAFPEPVPLVSDDLGVVYYASDQLYLTPKVSISYRIHTPSIDLTDITSIVHADLFDLLLSDKLQATVYEAKLAGLECDIERVDSTLKITVNGFANQAQNLLREVLEQAASLEITPEMFVTQKSRLETEYKNIQLQSPLRIGVETFREVIYKNYPSNQKKLEAIGNVTIDTFDAFSKTLFERAYIQALVYGALSKQEVEKLWSQTDDILLSEPYPLSEQTTKKVALLPEGEGPYFLEQNAKNSGHAVIISIEQPAFNFNRYAAQEVLSKSFGKEFFYQLRTLQQTSYIIGNASEETEQKLFTILALESHSHSVQDLLNRTELMVEDYLRQLEDKIPEDKFITIRDSLYLEESTPPESLKEMGKQLSDLAYKQDGNFQWRQQYLEALKTLSYEDFITITHEILGKQNRRRIAILVKGKLPQQGDLQYKKAKNLTWLQEKIDYQAR